MIPEREDFGGMNQELNFAAQTCFSSISGAIRAVNHMRQNAFNQPGLAFLSLFLWGISTCTDRVIENKKPPGTWHLFSSSLRDLCLLTKQPSLTETPLGRPAGCPCLVHRTLRGLWVAARVAGENRSCAKEGAALPVGQRWGTQTQQMGTPLPQEGWRGRFSEGPQSGLIQRWWKRENCSLLLVLNGLPPNKSFKFRHSCNLQWHLLKTFFLRIRTWWFVT